MNNDLKQAGSLLFAGLLGLISCRQPEFTNPEIKPLMEAVYASGFVQTKGEFQLKSQAEGVLKAQLVREGDSVYRGQILFQIESLAQGSRLSNAQANFDIASKNLSSSSPVLQELEKVSRINEQQFLADSVNFVRFANLWRERATSKTIYEEAETAFLTSRLVWLKGLDALESKKDQLRRDMENARQELISSREEQGFYDLKSDYDGIFFQSEREVGELVRKGDLLAVIGLQEGFVANLKVDEQDISRLRLGQKVIFQIDAYPGKNFRGKLDKIYSKIDSRDQMLRVDAVFTEPLPGNYSGLALEANIVVQEKSKALVIPGNFLLPGDSLWILREGKERKISVQPGIKTLSEVEVTVGIDAGTKLIKP